MWVNAQRDGRPAEYRWRPLLNAAKFRWRPLLECRAVTLPIIGEHKTWTQSEFCTWQNSVTGKEPRKCIHSVRAQETNKHRAKFACLLLSDVAAVTLPRRETRWNLLGCPKLVNRSQPLVGRSSPYCEDMSARYCCLTSIFSDCRHVLSCEDIGQQIVRWCPDGGFLTIFASCFFSEPRAAHFRPAS